MKERLLPVYVDGELLAVGVPEFDFQTQMALMVAGCKIGSGNDA